MPLFYTLLAVALTLILPVPSADAARIYRQYHYYTISGHSAEQLDKALARQGPYLKSTGNRHPGAARIRFKPAIKLRKTEKACRIEKANINVEAKISLPRWKERPTTPILELALVWDVLSRDIKRHEESHVIIARAHASEMEYALRALPSRRTCLLLQKDIEKSMNRILLAHNQAQLRFDRIETKSFNQRFNRLLNQRLKKVILIHNNKKYLLDLSQ